MLCKCIDSSAIANNSVRQEINAAKDCAKIFANSFDSYQKDHAYDSVMSCLYTYGVEDALFVAAGIRNLSSTQLFLLLARLSVLNIDVVAAEQNYDMAIQSDEAHKFDYLLEFSQFCRINNLNHKASDLGSRALNAASTPMQEYLSRLNMAIVHHNLNESDKTLRELNAISALHIKKAPKDMESTVNMIRGMAYLSKDEPNVAVLYYNDALEGFRKIKGLYVEPQFVLRELCAIHTLAGDYDKAIECISQAIEYSKQYRSEVDRNLSAATLYLQWGTILKSTGQYDKARERFMTSLQTISKIVAGNRNYVIDLAEIEAAQAALEIDMKDYRHAEALCEEANRIYSQEKFEYSPEAISGKASLLNTYGNLYTAMGHYNDAVKKYNEALENYNILSRSTQKTHRADMSVVLNNMGRMYDNMGEFDNAISYYKMAAMNLVTEHKLYPKYTASYANTLANIGNLYRRHNMVDSALYYLQEGLRIFRDKQTLNDIDKVDYSTICNNIAIIYRLTGKPEFAEPFYESAYQMRKYLSTKSSIYMPLWSDILNNYGLYYIDLRDFDMAVYYLDQALQVRERYSQNINTAQTCIIADNHDNLAYAHQLAGNTDEAIEHYEMSRLMRSGIVDQNPEMYLDDYLNTLHNLATLYRKDHRDIDALAVLTESAEAIQEFVPEPMPLSFKESMANTLHNISLLYSILGNRQQALDNMLDAIEHYKYLSEYRRRIYLTDLADSYNQAGNYCMDLESYADAEGYYRKALDILSGEYALNNVRAYDVAGTLNNLGLLYYTQNRLPEAKDCYQKARNIFCSDSGVAIDDIGTALNSAMTNINIVQYIIYEHNCGISDPDIANCGTYLDEAEAMLKPYLANESARYYYNYAVDLHDNLIK